MKFGAVLILVLVMITANVSATLIMAGNQMSAFAQRETNTGNVTSERIQEQTQLNADIRSEVDSNSREDRPSREIDSQPVPERNIAPDNRQDDALSPSTEVPSTESEISTEVGNSEVGNSNPNEVGNSNPNEVGNSNPNEVGVTDSNTQSQDISATEVQRNPRDDPIYQAAIGFAVGSVGESAKKMVTAIPKELANHIEIVLRASQDPELRALANSKWLSFIAGQRTPVVDALRLLEVATALDSAPNCPPNDPTCLPPPTEEPANCDPQITKSCFPESGKSPCTPAEISGATCKSGVIECEQTPLKHDILCQAEYPDGTTWQGVYFTPPVGKHQFSEQLCTPNPNPPPFKNCVIAFF